MALPTTFPQPPKRPPAAQPITDGSGLLTSAWAGYFDALDRYNVAVRAFLATLP